MNNNFNTHEEEKIDKSSLTYSKKQHSYQAGIVNESSSFKLYWKRFFSKWINIVYVTLFALLLLFIIFSALFYKYSPNKPIFDSQLASNLPDYLHSSLTRKFAFDDKEYLSIVQASNQHPDLNIIISNKQVGDSWTLVYNPYAYIEALTGHKYILYFGTNNAGVDRFSFYIQSLGRTIFITLVALVIEITLGSYFGALVSYFSKKTGAKVSYYLVSTINIIPFLIVVFLLFSLCGYSPFNAIMILGFIGAVSFFYISYSLGLDLKNNEYITAYKATGLNDFQIVTTILFPRIFYRNLSLASDNMSLNILAIASLAFFNAKGIEDTLNLGNVFKDIISDISNISFTSFVIVITSLYVILVKLLGINMYLASNPLIAK